MISVSFIRIAKVRQKDASKKISQESINIILSHQRSALVLTYPVDDQKRHACTEDSKSHSAHNLETARQKEFKTRYTDERLQNTEKRTDCVFQPDWTIACRRLYLLTVSKRVSFCMWLRRFLLFSRRRTDVVGDTHKQRQDRKEPEDDAQWPRHAQLQRRRLAFKMERQHNG